MTAGRRILICWEVGANYGHAAQISQLLPWFPEDWQIIAAVRDPVSFRTLIPDPRIQVMAAPFAPEIKVTRKEAVGLSYPDVLRFIGWHDADVLTAYLECWQVLIREIGADVVLTQAAPTALLAARAFGTPRVAMGGGYDLPPRATPMPRFLHWDPGDQEELEKREAAVVDRANVALQRRGIPRIETFREILDVERYLMVTVPELDHYGDRSAIEPTHTPYLGPITGIRFGQDVTWRPDADYRIFAYLRPGNTRLETAIKALASLPAETDAILAAPGAPASLPDRLRDTSVRLFTSPVNVDPLLADCDLGVSHASSNIATNFAMNGVPQIGLPNHTEQTMMAHAFSKGHLGLGLVGNASPEQLLHAIELVRSSAQVTDSTVEFSRRWAPDDAGKTGRRAAEQIMSLF
ncbi:hypothetical protein [uncultured Roseibium sp.]|uniref:glycosyltransferase n=1 Tax=uncultured Roseibium sp. TaxID=1936171 RepID=UPI002606119E|nr:hypothetical protein [uncultured Roseibium sp.]